MPNNSIRLSPAHGLNPCIPSCFFCGQDKNEVLLLGKLKGSGKDPDPEAPHRAVFDKEPCDKCKEFMEKGIILISVRDGESGDNPYRTGGWCVVSEDYLRRVLHGDAAGHICEVRMAFVPDEAWDKLGLPRGEDKEAV